MQLEFQELESRYEHLRLVRPEKERRLLASLAEVGQQVPIVVLGDSRPNRYVVIDGYKRIRALRRLSHDTVEATRLELDEADALVLTRSMRSDEGTAALEEAWLLDELERRFGMTQETLSRRFDRSVSWVSRRLGLVRELPDVVHESVRRGAIAPHAAVKYLVPLARAKSSDCVLLAKAISGARLSTREVGLLYCAWRDGTSKTRERLKGDPLLFLKALKAAREPSTERERSPAQVLLDDLQLMGRVARRLERQLRDGLGRRLLPEEHDEVRRALMQTRLELERLGRRMDKEVADARPGSTDSDCRAQTPADADSSHRSAAEGVASSGAQGAASGHLNGPSSRA